MRIVAYTYRAEIYCPACISTVLTGTADGDFGGWALADGADKMTAEEDLDEIAAAFGIDRMDEHTFDSGYFPKVVFSSQIEDHEECGECGEEVA